MIGPIWLHLRSLPTATLAPATVAPAHCYSIFGLFFYNNILIELLWEDFNFLHCVYLLSILFIKTALLRLLCLYFLLLFTYFLLYTADSFIIKGIKMILMPHKSRPHQIMMWTFIYIFFPVIMNVTIDTFANKFRICISCTEFKQFNSACIKVFFANFIR